MFDESGLVSNKGLLKYEQIISLQSICAVNIVTNLWINEKVELEKCFYECGSEIKFGNITKNILSKVNQLHLPRMITDQLVSVIEFVGNALRSWIAFHDKYLFKYDHMHNVETDDMCNVWIKYDYCKDNLEVRTDSLSTKYLHLIKFTNNGIIDQLQTAKNIVLSEPNPKLKYRLASHYCLEEEFEHMPSTIKKHFCKRFVEEFFKGENLNIHENPMLFYWTYNNVNDNRHLFEVMMKNNSDDKSLNEYIIDAVLEKYLGESLYCEVPIMYLWNKLTNSEKSNKMVINVIEGLENPALKFSFISSLDYNQQQIIFKDISFKFLRNMLYNLLWRDRFVYTICHLFDILDQHTYYVLIILLAKIISYHLDVNDKFCSLQSYKGILNALWEQTPYPFKEYVFMELSGGQIIRLFYQLNWDINFDLIQIMLDDMPVTYKKNVIYSKMGVKQCFCFIVEEKWVLLDLFIKNFLVRDENQHEFKEHFISKYVMKICFYHLERDNWGKIKIFLNWAFNSDHEIADFKRSVRLVKTSCDYYVYSLQNAADKYEWNCPTKQSLLIFEKFFFK